jgi:YVTN family beta-propeller protein
MISGTVSVIDTTDDTVITTIPVGVGPLEVLYCPLNDRIYVTNMGDGTVSVINPNLNTIVATVAAGVQPRYMTYCAATRTIWVSDFVGFVITIIDAATNTVSATIPFAEYPGALCFVPLNDYVYCSYSAYQHLLAINPYTLNVDEIIDQPENTQAMIYCTKNRLLYCLGRTSGNVWVLDPASNTEYKYFYVGALIWCVTYRPADGYLYFGVNFPGYQVVVLEPLQNAIVYRIDAETEQGLCYASNNEKIYGANGLTNNVDVFSGIPYIPIGLFHCWRWFASKLNGSCPPVNLPSWAGVYDLGRARPDVSVSVRTINLLNGVGRVVHTTTSLVEP